MKSKTNLKLAQRAAGEENRTLSRREARARVKALREEFETYRDQIDAAAFDILSGEMPLQPLDRERRWTVNVIRDLNPAVKK